jgi:hypothetical protein
MHIRRGLLCWGLFLIPLGAVPLLVRAGAVDAASLAGAWRLWPIILIALGLALVAGRSQVAVIGTAVTAIILGVAAGGALATGNPWFGVLGDCATGRNTTSQLDQSGSFQSSASVRLNLSCGTLQASTGDGSDWALHADYSGPPPTIAASADRLEIRSPDSGGSRRQAWNLSLPPALGALDLRANAGSGTINLAGADVGKLSAEINAFDLSVDASEAKVQQLDVTLNAGRARIILGGGPLTGDLSVNAGAIELCVPASAQLQVKLTNQVTFAQNLDDRGLSQNGDLWTRNGNGDLAAAIQLTVDGAAASFTLDPDGGCR